MDQYELALRALRSLKPGEMPSIDLVARTYGVDRSQLSRRVRGVPAQKKHNTTVNVMVPALEQAPGMSAGGAWLHNQDIFSVQNLACLWPTLPTIHITNGYTANVDASSRLAPEAGAFDENSRPDGVAPRDPWYYSNV
ncbi:hypothetical protein ZTR_09669 [Talaromyces verruculosus]|nr:hypothetical protein ZTR_09669 [Talaromyces verruculosus]